MAAGAGVWVRPFREGWRVYYRLEPGGVLHGKAGFRDAQVAEDWAAKMRSRITTRRRTVGDAIEDYRLEMEARVGRGEMRDCTARQNTQRLRRLMADVVDLPLGSLTPRRCGELYEALANGGELAVGTQHITLAAARAWGSWVVKKGWFKASPWATVEKIGKANDSRDRSLRVDEARALRSLAIKLASKGDEGALTTLITLTCSLRPSEVVQIVARDVDDEGRILWVAGARLKNQNTRRQIAIVDEDLQRLLVARAAGLPKEARLFDRNQKFVTEAAKRLSRAAKVPVVDARALRRTFATLDARRGSSLDALAFSMGHGADGGAKTARRHYVAAGAVETGAARRVLGVLDGGKAKEKGAR